MLDAWQTVQRPRVRHIQQTVADQFGLTLNDILDYCREGPVAWPRQMAMLIAYEVRDDLSLEQIARLFRRDHSTVCHGIKAARQRNEERQEYAAAYELVRRRIEATRPIVLGRAA